MRRYRIEAAHLITGICLAVGFAAMRAEGVDAFSYVRRGLGACYDGIENAGAGVHDASATTWTDLTGNGHTGTMGDGVTWAENGWVNESTAKPVSVGSSLAALTGAETFTMEFTGTRATTGRGVLFGQYSNIFGVNFEYVANGTSATANSLRLHFYRCLASSNTLNQYTSQATTFPNGGSATLALTAATKERGLWKNGVLGAFTVTNDLPILFRTTTCDSVIGGDAARAGTYQCPFVGTCNAFRLYDRVLTVDELAVNTAVDAVRFRGADPSTLTLPSGWAFDAQTNLLATVTATACGHGTVRMGDGEETASVTTNVVVDSASSALTFTATPEEGYEFVTWGASADAVLSRDGTSVTINGFEPVTLQAIFRTEAEPTTSTEDFNYVTDGLVVWYDGIDNAGVGTHSATATTWTDLSGNNRDATLASDVGWASNGWTNNVNCYPVSLSDATGTAVTETLATRTFTIEFLSRPSRTTSRENFFGSYNTGGLGIEHNSSSKANGQLRLFYNGNPNYDTDVTQVAGEAAMFSLVSAPSSQLVYKNATLAFEGSTTVASGKLSASATYYIGCDASRPKYAFKGKFHSFRLYDRLLSAAEVAQNMAADRARFLAAGATTWTNSASGSWLDAESWNYGIPNTCTAASITKSGASKSIAITSEVPATTNITVSNASGTTQVRVADGGSLPIENAALSLGKGSELLVEEGGVVSYSGANSPIAQGVAAIAVSDGGKLSIDGGTVNVDDLSGLLTIAGAESYTGRVSITSGNLNIYTPHPNHGIQVLTGGLLEMTGGTLCVKRTTECADNYMLLTLGGTIELSGDAEFLYKDMPITFGTGKIHLRDNAVMAASSTWNGDSQHSSAFSRIRLLPSAAQTVEVTVDDDAALDMYGEKKIVYVCHNRERGRAILNWNTSKTLDSVQSLAVGYVNGYGELNVSNGQAIGGSCGLRVAQCGMTPTDNCCVTGVVNVTGGSVINTGCYNNNDTFHGLIVGAGAVVNLESPGFFRGTLTISGGAVTNVSHYFGVGIGMAEGDVLQTGGEVVHSPDNHQMVVGAFGAEGRYIMSNGVTTANSDVFVGGVETNLLHHKPYKLYTTCPVTNHCASGLLRVAGGSFTTAQTLWISQDGAGVLEVGPSGTVTAANVTLTNTPAARTGGADLAAQVKFTAGAQSTGLVAVSDKLTIGPGVALEVDSTAMEEKGLFPLITFASREGDFESITVTGRGSVLKTDTGYYLDRTGATVLLVR